MRRARLAHGGNAADASDMRVCHHAQIAVFNTQSEDATSGHADVHVPRRFVAVTIVAVRYRREAQRVSSEGGEGVVVRSSPDTDVEGRWGRFMPREVLHILLLVPLPPTPRVLLLLQLLRQLATIPGREPYLVLRHIAAHRARPVVAYGMFRRNCAVQQCPCSASTMCLEKQPGRWSGGRNILIRQMQCTPVAVHAEQQRGSSML